MAISEKMHDKVESRSCAFMEASLNEERPRVRRWVLGKLVDAFGAEGRAKCLSLNLKKVKEESTKLLILSTDFSGI